MVQQRLDFSFIQKLPNALGLVHTLYLPMATNNITLLLFVQCSSKSRDARPTKALLMILLYCIVLYCVCESVCMFGTCSQNHST